MTSREIIVYVTLPSNLDSVLVAQSAKGICAIQITNNPALLFADLQKRFPEATLVEGDSTLEELAAKVVWYVENPKDSLNIPLDMRGTDFQKRVWNELQKIPAGQTLSYKEVAVKLNTPTAVRAVAGACAANALAVVIPCHRVVRSDGSVSGYRWGVERKRKLLNREAV